MEYLGKRLNAVSFFAPVTNSAPENTMEYKAGEERCGMCWRDWRLVGLAALSLGAAILVTAIFPAGFGLLLAALLLILCGVGLLKRR